MAYPIRVTPYEWNRGRFDARHGAMIRHDTAWFFIAADDLYRVADALVDIAEGLAQKQEDAA